MYGDNINRNNLVPWAISDSFFENDGTKLKSPSDVFNVYVNGEFVGEKELVAQGDGGINSVKEYLMGRGFKDFDYKAEGNSIYINSDDLDTSRDMINHLRVYLDIR